MCNMYTHMVFDGDVGHTASHHTRTDHSLVA